MIKEEYLEYANIFHALGHPIRLAIIKGLINNECNVSKIVNKLKIPQATISQHLSVLKSAGIIRGERRGVSMCYKVINDKVKNILVNIKGGQK